MRAGVVSIAVFAAFAVTAVTLVLSSCKAACVDPMQGAGGVHSCFSTCVVESVDEEASEIVLTFQSGKPDWIEEDTVVFGTTRVGYSGEERGGCAGDVVVIEYKRTPPGGRVEIELITPR